MTRHTRKRRGGVDEDPKKPQQETIGVDSIPAENPVNVPSLGPDPPTGRPRVSSTGTLIAEEGGRRRRASRKTRKSKKQGGRRRKYSRRH